MLGFNSLKYNGKGNLEFSGCDTVDLAKEYGTPLYVMDEAEIRRRCREIRENHIEKYKGFAVYASKAFLNREMCRIIMSEGIGLDVVSGGELFTAHSVSFPMKNIIFHGSNKSVEELEMAVDFGVGRIAVDNFNEIENLKKILKKKNKKINIILRISPGIDGHTHEFISTGNVDSKFGFSVFDGNAFKAVKTVLGNEHFNLLGLHAHIGSQLLDNKVYEIEAKVFAEFALKLKEELGYEMKELNAGGGFGIFYAEGDERRDLSYFTDKINSSVIREFRRFGLKIPMVIIEPGRWLVGEAGITLYEIGAIKDIKDIRKYVSVDGGMADNIRHPLYDAVYTALIASRKDDNPKEVVTIAGRCCESGDVLIRNIELPVVQSGDILAVLSTGAYNYSMSSNYNRLRKPAVIMVNNGKHRLIVKRETYEDIIKNDI